MNSKYQPAYYEVYGTSFEQGVQLGKLLKAPIEENLKNIYCKLKDNAVDMVRYRQFVSKNIIFLKNNRKDMYTELKGISEGSGIPFEEILILNIPAYFLFKHFTCITSECSMLCVNGKATCDGSTYIIKNRDMGNPDMIQALIKRTYPDGTKLLEVSGAGTVTFPSVGINQHGLAVTTTGFWSPKDPTRIDKVEEADIFLNVRVLLTTCKTACEAMEFCRTAPRMNGLNVLAADCNEAYVAEMTADDIYVEKAGESGILYRTNHVVSDKFKYLNEPEDIWRSSFSRYKRIGEMLETRRDKGIRFQDLMRIMSDHKYEPFGLCNHPHEGSLGHTVSTTICSVNDFEIWTSISNLCLALPHASLKE